MSFQDGQVKVLTKCGEVIDYSLFLMMQDGLTIKEIKGVYKFQNVLEKEKRNNPKK